MANLQVRNMPDELHERLRRCAQQRNCSMSAVVLQAVERELEWSEWQERWESSPEIDLGISAAEVLDEVRRERDEELYGRLRS
ncbi:FitA-like ribbon-helix-helix domain-containing protein [Candidatus Poriferisodalis sp.]|uniref:FitA-like ribbon-helix-helix domain-containing protein n=1 Tax=Candidatus Poriferisodalis sp. TaxID=3101277 RepID=UPI003AF55485